MNSLKCQLLTLKNIQIPERANLYELMSGEPFVSFVNDERLMMAAHYIRKVGNLADFPCFVAVGKDTYIILFFEADYLRLHL